MKTLAIRLEDELHAQLSVLAQLRESTITDEIRMAIESHLDATKASPELSGRAQAVLDEIERDSQARQAAIATLFGVTQQPTVEGEAAGTATAPASKPPTGKTMKA